MKKKNAVHLADGFEEVEAISIIDVLRRADLEVLVVSVTGKHEVSGAHQVRIVSDTLFEQVNYDEIYKKPFLKRKLIWYPDKCWWNKKHTLSLLGQAKRENKQFNKSDA